MKLALRVEHLLHTLSAAITDETDSKYVRNRLLEVNSEPKGSKTTVRNLVIVIVALGHPDCRATGSENLEDKKVCGQCIGDKLIAGEIRSDGERGQCSYCEHRRKCIAVLSLSERVDDVYREQYQPGEQEAYFYGDSDKPSFTTRGENPAEIIGDLLQCEPQIAEDIAKILGSKEAYDVHKDGATPMYDATSNYSVRPIRAYEFADRWSEFVDTVKHKSRFFLENGVGILDDLFEGIADLQHQGDRAPVRTIGKRSEERFIVSTPLTPSFPR